MNKKFTNQMEMQPEKLLEITTITRSYDIIDIYLTDSGIGGTSEHLDQIRAIQEANETDVVRVHCLNSVGGDANCIITILNALANTPAHTVCFLEGQNSSAGSMPFLVCNEAVIGDYASVMIHTVSGGTKGTVGNTLAESQFSDRLFSKFLEDIYYGFLSPSELSQVLDGKEFYFSSDEIRERLEIRKELIAQEVAEEQEGCDDPTCPCHEEEASLEASVVEEQQ